MRFQIAFWGMNFLWDGGRKSGRIPLKVCGNHLLRQKGCESPRTEDGPPQLVEPRAHGVEAHHCCKARLFLLQTCFSSRTIINGERPSQQSSQPLQTTYLQKAAMKIGQRRCQVLISFPSPQCLSYSKPSHQHLLLPVPWRPWVPFCVLFVWPTVASLGQETRRRVQVLESYWSEEQEKPEFR